MMSGFDIAKNHHKNKKDKKSQAYIDFLQDVKEFDEGNFKISVSVKRQVFRLDLKETNIKRKVL